MNISGKISANTVFLALEAANKMQLLQELSGKVADLANVDRRVVFDSVWEREMLGSTGYGHGTAFPHARVEGVEQVFIVFARLAEPMEFGAVDGKPVDLVFLLVSPENSGADHLTALANLSRILKNEDVCDKLRRAKTTEEVCALLTL